MLLLRRAANTPRLAAGGDDQHVAEELHAGAGHVASTPSRRLSELGEGAAAVVGRVDDRDDALLRFLAERGLVPEARVSDTALYDVLTAEDVSVTRGPWLPEIM